MSACSAAVYVTMCLLCYYSSPTGTACQSFRTLLTLCVMSALVYYD